MSPEREDFQRTLQEISAGSPEAVEHFIMTYGPHVQRVVRRRLGTHLRSKFDSADFVQMVWVSFFRYRHRLPNIHSAKELLTFLTVMARNKVVDETRRRTSDETMLPQSQDSSQPVENQMVHAVDHSTPSQYAMAQERWQRLMSDPSERNRRIVQMRMQGASYAEIAGRLAIGETTVREILLRCVGDHP